MVKRLLYLCITLVLPMLSFGNDQAKDLFAKGNAYYAKAQYKDALTTYEQLLNEGYHSASLYFNMGNASFKTDDIPSAILYYEKAHKLLPGDDDINFNIQFANARTTDKIVEEPEFFLSKWWRLCILQFSLNTLAAVSIILIVFGSAILILYFFSNATSVKKLSFYMSMILFFLGLVALFVANRQASYFDNHKQAIIFTESVNIKSGPIDKSRILFVLHDGTKVNVLENNEGWIKIRLVNGNEGWIKATDVKEI